MKSALKGTTWDDRLSFNFALFRADYTDQQITRQEPTATGVASFVDNAGSSTIQGAELEGAIAFTDRLTLSYGLGWTDAEFDEYNTYTLVPNPAPPPTNISVPIDLADSAVFQNTPEWNGNLTLTYAQPLSAGWGSLLGTLTGSYRDSYHMFEFENPLLDQTEDYTLVDASVAWTLANDKLTLPADRAATSPTRNTRSAATTSRGAVRQHRQQLLRPAAHGQLERELPLRLIARLMRLGPWAGTTYRGRSSPT